ncbi:hypothetical protein [Roseburia sp. 499]|nr:hypothetical protein [Roseburia sp. 499]WVK70983.1 hypothetical protein BIV20_05455 [Roseburia sp. 499]
MKGPEEVKKQPLAEEAEKETKQPLSETWSQDAQDELQEFIELQGIYIRQ